MTGARRRVEEFDLAAFLHWLPRNLGYFHLPRIASWVRKRWVLLRHPHATIEFGDHVYLGPGFHLEMPYSGTFIAGDGVEFRRGFQGEVNGNGRLVIGSGTKFNYDCVVQCGTTIEIGRNCVFAHAVTIVDGSHRFRDAETPVLAQGYDYRPIKIGDDASVMAKATVIASIGERCFVGANSVVTRELPDHCLAVGAPARPIDSFAPKESPAA